MATTRESTLKDIEGAIAEYKARPCISLRERLEEAFQRWQAAEKAARDHAMGIRARASMGPKETPSMHGSASGGIVSLLEHRLLWDLVRSVADSLDAARMGHNPWQETQDTIERLEDEFEDPGADVLGTARKGGRAR